MNPSCITTGRILAAYQLYLKEYEPASETSRSALEALHRLREDAGILILAPEIALQILLATSLIHYQAPKHHPQARSLFDTVLARKPNSIEALIGKGRVALEAGEFEEAIEFTSKALELEPTNVDARMEHAWALVLTNSLQDGKSELREALRLVDGRDAHSRDMIAEIWWRIGKCLWDEGMMAFRCLLIFQTQKILETKRTLPLSPP